MPIAQDACQKIDLFKYTAPQLGAVLAGGTQRTQGGITGTLGGLGQSVSIGLLSRECLRASLPEVDRWFPHTRCAGEHLFWWTIRQRGFVTGDLALGLFKASLGLTNVGGLVCLSVPAYVPTTPRGAFDVTLPGGAGSSRTAASLDSSRKPRFCRRIISFLERELPRVDIAGRPGEDRLFLDASGCACRGSGAPLPARVALPRLGGVWTGIPTRDNAAILVSVVRDDDRGRKRRPYPAVAHAQAGNKQIFGHCRVRRRCSGLNRGDGRVSGGNFNVQQFEGAQPADNRILASVGFRFGK